MFAADLCSRHGRGAWRRGPGWHARDPLRRASRRASLSAFVCRRVVEDGHDDD
jgi:hypothetical protein